MADYLGVLTRPIWRLVAPHLPRLGQECFVAFSRGTPSPVAYVGLSFPIRCFFVDSQVTKTTPIPCAATVLSAHALFAYRMDAMHSIASPRCVCACVRPQECHKLESPPQCPFLFICLDGTSFVFIIPAFSSPFFPNLFIREELDPGAFASWLAVLYTTTSQCAFLVSVLVLSRILVCSSWSTAPNQQLFEFGYKTEHSGSVQI